jgi:glycosyltransferase involved in cell wall biosynthesis
MPFPEVTIVVIPREQFSKAESSLESIFAHTRPPYSLIYIDGKSPHYLRRYLQLQAQARDFQLIRVERLLPANEARNLAIPYLKSKYTVFIDNDVIVSPGWLEPLVECADETGSWVVGPIYCVGNPADPEIHTLGAEHGIDDEHGKCRWRERHLYCGQALNAVRHEIARRPIDLVEFHCLLMRTDALERVGRFDPALLSYFDHNDFCLQVQKAGGAIYAEPRSVVRYLQPPPLAATDLPYFLLRWSDHWINASVAHFASKYGLDATDPNFSGHYQYHRAQRNRVFRDSPLMRNPRRVVRKLLGGQTLSRLDATIERALDRTLLRNYQ